MVSSSLKSKLDFDINTVRAEPINFLSESSLPGEGGWWSDARQVSTEPFQVGIPEGGVPQW